jgi:hypothetical protein
MRALVVGGADCLWDDLASLGGWTPDIVVAVNDAIAAYPHWIDHAATLHPEKLVGWRLARWRNGGNGDYTTWSRRNAELVDRILTGWNQGSSGMFAVGVALEMGAERVVLAGVPMTETPHFFSAEPWVGVRHHRDAWEKRADEMRGRVVSCSGWTRELLGGPDAIVGERQRAA